MAAKNPWETEWSTLCDLSEGAQGRTYKVKSLADGSLGVLKVLKNKKSQQARLRMWNEVGNMQTVGEAGGKVPAILSRGTVDTYATVDDSGVLKSPVLFFVMEHVAGKTLKQHVSDQGPMHVDDAIKFILSLGETIAIAHTYTVYHRDLKPDNIVIRNTGGSTEAVILDFGLSFNHSSQEGNTGIDETFKSDFIDIPEARTRGGNKRIPQSDLLALAGVLFYCLTGVYPGTLRDEKGRPPHRREGGTLKEHHASDLRIHEIDRFLTKGLQNNVSDRFQNIDDFTASLEVVRSGTAKPLDLSSVLAEASQALVARDRKTQLSRFRDAAEKSLQRIINRANQIKNSSPDFAVYISQFPCDPIIQTARQFRGPDEDARRANIENTVSPPSKLDPCCDGGVTLSLWSNHHEISQSVFIRIAARGNEAVVIRRSIKELQRDTANGNQIQRPHTIDANAFAGNQIGSGGWTEVFTYNAAEEPQGEALEVQVVDEWIANGVKRIVDQLTGNPRHTERVSEILEDVWQKSELYKTVFGDAETVLVKKHGKINARTVLSHVSFNSALKTIGLAHWFERNENKDQSGHVFVGEPGTKGLLNFGTQFPNWLENHYGHTRGVLVQKLSSEGMSTEDFLRKTSEP